MKSDTIPAGCLFILLLAFIFYVWADLCARMDASEQRLQRRLDRVAPPDNSGRWIYRDNRVTN